MLSAFLKSYREKVSRGELTPDAGQERAAQVLHRLYCALEIYKDERQKKSFIQKLSHKVQGRTAEPAVKGVYMVGSVGRGKTMLMDMFYDTVPVAADEKRRLHFHEFMAEVHERLHGYRKKSEKNRASKKPAKKNGDQNGPLQKLAQEMAAESWLLCFDEFHVHNVADAMILSRLFTALFEAGVVVVATSNWVPDDLYKDGLQREHFIPFIGLIKDQTEVVDIGPGQDHRLERLEAEDIYLIPANEENNRRLEELFTLMTGGTPPQERVIQRKGRTLPVPKAAKRLAAFDFKDLCEAALGAEDYLALTERFETIFLHNVPQMTPQDRNEAKRFMTLIDTLYEKGVKLICSADGPPEDLYPAGDQSFDFQRTVSRLKEMQSQDYLEKPLKMAS